MNRAPLPMCSIFAFATISLVTVANALAGSQTSVAPAGSSEQTVLFDSIEPLQIVIATDMRTLLRDIDSLERTEHEGTLTYAQPDGGLQTLDIQIRTRGHFRRQRRNCNFPPLRVNLKKGQLPGTVFQNQDKIKLVTHCQNGRDEYEQNVLEEYLIYRLYNNLSEASHRVRLAHITYQDTTGREDTMTRYGFFIEHEDELANRLGGEVLTQPLPPDAMQPDMMGIVDVFEYMIGNTDWSVVGMHNIIVIGTQGDFYPIPYDFDWTGVVDARYAEPDERLRLRSVRDRLYRGMCRTADDFAMIFEWFVEQRDILYEEIVMIDGLDERNQRDITEYFDDFFKTLNNPRDARQAFMSRCR